MDIKYKGEDNPNYLDENINIDLPVFIIHGNHDYPVHQFGDLSCLDLMHKANCLNYFGKHNDYENMVIKPIMFCKNDINIAIYGIGHIKDLRLHDQFERKKVKFERPS